MNKLQHKFEGAVTQLVGIFNDVGYNEEERQSILQVRRFFFKNQVQPALHERHKTRPVMVSVSRRGFGPA